MSEMIAAFIMLFIIIGVVECNETIDKRREIECFKLTGNKFCFSDIRNGEMNDKEK